jgi:hypothetical protein
MGISNLSDRNSSSTSKSKQRRKNQESFITSNPLDRAFIGKFFVFMRMRS